MTPLLPTGFVDRLPPHGDAAADSEACMLGAAARHGYERVEPPPVEYADVLQMRLKSGALGNAVRFVDPDGGRGLAIRPDVTAQVARNAATRMAHRPRPLRLSYAGAVLSLRASELTPARERRQLGCELIGRDTVAAAREIVGLAVEALAAAGATGGSVDFTLPDLVETLATGPLPVTGVDALRDRLDAEDAGAVVTLASRLDGLAAVAEALGEDVTLTLEPTERHGFEYQTWLGFSLFAADAPREVGRGGTYTVLHEDGGEEPAVGVSLFPGVLPAQHRRERRRLFSPQGTPVREGVSLRAGGWVTVAALDAEDTPEAQLCTHVWRGGAATPR